MAAYRCSLCAINWPPATRFKQCPECEERCGWISNTSPEMAESEADSRSRHAEFRRFCEGWDDERERRGEPTPEQLGRLEARRLIRKFRDVARGLETETSAG